MLILNIYHVQIKKYTDMLLINKFYVSFVLHLAATKYCSPFIGKCHAKVRPSDYTFSLCNQKQRILTFYISNVKLKKWTYGETVRRCIVPFRTKQQLSRLHPNIFTGASNLQFLPLMSSVCIFSPVVYCCMPWKRMQQ